MTEELKLCPFCGGKAHYYYEKGNDSIVCEECGAKLTYLDFGDPNDELVKQWNTRQIEDKLHEKIDNLATENDILRLYLAEIAVGVDGDSLEYTREGMIEMAKEALKGKEE